MSVFLWAVLRSYCLLPNQTEPSGCCSQLLEHICCLWAAAVGLQLAVVLAARLLMPGCSCVWRILTLTSGELSLLYADSWLKGWWLFSLSSALQFVCAVVCGLIEVPLINVEHPASQSYQASEWLREVLKSTNVVPATLADCSQQAVCTLAAVAFCVICLNPFWWASIMGEDMADWLGERPAPTVAARLSVEGYKTQALRTTAQELQSLKRVMQSTASDQMGKLSPAGKAAADSWLAYPHA
eukprot:gnl/Hemi2/4995_TR1727_c0_g1_i1.p1 gnl/Hemi2/4995_TR1727_c0_g1~~gnl/Hemi2/4995_TR1727_c0_g1_i1.p1  ORF type:complete len:241 (-),score=73.22 gnl/Hemi2/4995_TR1727_c0_g1_i1:115-837(-)